MCHLTFGVQGNSATTLDDNYRHQERQDITYERAHTLGARLFKFAEIDGRPIDFLALVLQNIERLMCY